MEAVRDQMVQAIGTVTIGGEAVTKQQRSLVAALSLHRKSGATVDVLVDAMWGERAPASARKSVQNQIVRLRQSFGSDLIVTRDDRYFLDAPTDTDHIDILSTECAAHAAGSRLQASQIGRIAEALAAWRGEPFTDLPDDPTASAERARLERIRSRLVETLALARLNGCPGDWDAAIVDLTVRTSTHPLHERVWELLVAALHMSGRRTEALGIYSDWCALLQEQLGAAPSRSFQHLRTLVDADEQFDMVAYFTLTARHAGPPLLVSA